MKIKKPILLMVTVILMIAAVTLLVNAGFTTGTTDVVLSAPADNIGVAVQNNVLNFTFYWTNTSAFLYNDTDAVGAVNGNMTANCTLLNVTTGSGTNWNQTLESFGGNHPGISMQNITNDTTVNIKADLAFANNTAYSWTVNCTNSSGILTGGSAKGYADSTTNISATAFTFTFDQVPPTIANASVINASWVSDVNRINITVVDAGIGVNTSKVYYRLYNSSENQTAWLIMTNTNTGTASLFNATLDTENATLGENGTTGLADGRYNISFRANDSISYGYGNDNMNWTNNTDQGFGNFTIMIDNTDPTVDHTCDTTATFKDGVITCTCNGIDPGAGGSAPNGSGIDSTDWTTNPDTSGAGDFTTTCTVTDLAGNSATNTISYSVRRSGGGAGTGGSSTGTGVPATTTAAMATQTIASIAADTLGEVTFDSEDISVKIVGLMPITYVTNVKVTIESLSGRPTATSIPTGNTYQYLKFDVTNIADNLKSGEITFRVPNSWFTSMNINKDSVALYRDVGGQWTKLPTTIESEESGGITFKATTTGFSYFVIAGQQKGVDVEETPTGETTPTTTTPKPTMSSIPTWLWIVIAVIVIGIVAFYFFGKKKKG